MDTFFIETPIRIIKAISCWGQGKKDAVAEIDPGYGATSIVKEKTRDTVILTNRMNHVPLLTRFVGIWATFTWHAY